MFVCVDHQIDPVRFLKCFSVKIIPKQMLLLLWLDQKSAETGLQRLAPVERRAALEQLSGTARWDPETILVYSWHHVEENSTCRDLPWCMVP